MNTQFKNRLKSLLALSAVVVAPLAHAGAADPHLVVQSALWGDGPSYEAAPMAGQGLRGPAGPVLGDSGNTFDAHAAIQRAMFAEGPSYPSRDELKGGLRGAAGPVMADDVSVSSNHFDYQAHFVAD